MNSARLACNSTLLISSFSQANIASRLRSTPITWRPLPGYLIISLLAVLAFLKGRERAENSRIERERRENGIQSGVHIEGPWQVKVLGALPLRSISRLYGLLNSYELPVWFRVPGYHLYSLCACSLCGFGDFLTLADSIFGVDISEADVQDLKQYKSLQEFFLRRLRPGVRPISDAAVVSPADGKVVNFGLIEERRVGSVKGMTVSLLVLSEGPTLADPRVTQYSVDALLQGLGSSQPGTPQPATNGNGDGNGSPKHTRLSDSQFANINDISYSVHELMGEGQVPASQVSKDASIESHPVQQGGDSDSKFNRDVKVASSVMQGDFESLGGYTGVPRPGNKMFFAVVYLHPGDYHRFHSPVSWVVERRRHFAGTSSPRFELRKVADHPRTGELFSVSPWMVGKLADLFTLNERVALLGRWRHGFFSYTPVGATNVGSIMINFDSHLRTNNPQRPLRPGTFDEAVYSQASRLLGGQPVEKGEEMGGFSLGSTIVLVFEAPEKFRFVVEKGKHVKYGEPLGIC